jgi:hypothetical protein
MHCFHVCVFSTPCFVLSAMDVKIERRDCIKFRVKLGKFATASFQTLREASGERTLSRRAVYDLHSHFKAVRLPAEDERLERPSTSKTTENVEVQKPSNSECYKPSSEHFRVYKAVLLKRLKFITSLYSITYRTHSENRNTS